MSQSRVVSVTNTRHRFDHIVTFVRNNGERSYVNPSISSKVRVAMLGQRLVDRRLGLIVLSSYDWTVRMMGS